MKIYRTVTRVPGGMMVVPLFIGMALNTFAPDLMKIGGFTQALTGVGYPTILGMYLFTVGTKMTVRTAPRMLMRGFGLLLAKVGTATLLALALQHWFGGELLGLSTLAVMVAMSDTNGGMFLALTGVMGDKDDSGTYVVQSVETGPFLTMLIFVGAGLAVIPWLTMVSVIAPIAAGAILGNLDEDLQKFFGSHEPIIIPFMAFTLGQTINLTSVVTAGLPGIALGVAVVLITGVVCILADRLLGGSGVAGAAASSTAGNSAAVPQAVALADPSFAAVAPAATVQVTASVIVTAVLTPLLTAWWFRRVKKRAVVAAIVIASLFSLTPASTAYAQARSVQSEQDALIELEHQWNDAFYKKDMDFLRRILADDFAATYEDGSRGDKARELSLVESFNQHVDSSVQDDFTVRVDHDTAVVWFTLTLVGPRQGVATTVILRYIDVFAFRDGRWQCVSSQSTKVGEK